MPRQWRVGSALGAVWYQRHSIFRAVVELDKNFSSAFLATAQMCLDPRPKNELLNFDIWKWGYQSLKGSGLLLLLIATFVIALSMVRF